MDTGSDFTSPTIPLHTTTPSLTTTVDAPQPQSSVTANPLLPNALPLSHTNPHSPQGHDYDANHPPNSRLFVVCSKTLNEADIRDAFSAYGDIQDVYIIRDKTPARASKGVCFIKFYKSSDACRAMEELNGKHIKDCDRPIKVLIAQSRGNEKNTSWGSANSQTFGAIRGSSSTNGVQEEENIENFLRLFVAVDKKQTSDEIKDYFAKFGLVDHVHILKDKESGESRGVAFVKYYKASHAALALEEATPEYKAILADPRPQRNTPSNPAVNPLNHSYNVPAPAQTNAHAHSHAPLMGPGFHGGSAQYTAPSLMNVKNESSLNPVHPLNHPGFSHQGHAFSHYGGASATSVATPSNVQPLFQPNVPNSHHPGSAVAAAALMQMAACGDEAHPNPTPPWLAAPPHMQPPNAAVPSFEHVNLACRTLGFNATRIQAFVDPSLSEEQLRSIFDLVPGLDSFHISLDQRKGLPNGIAHATYAMPIAALYAREKLNGLEYPPGFRMVVKFLDEPYNSSTNRFAHPTSNQVLGLQVTRAMGLGLGSFQPVSASNGVSATNHKSTEISNGGDASQDVETRNESGVRGYLFPSVNAYPVGNNGESYPSFTSSSSGGSGTTSNTNNNDRNRRKSNPNNPNNQQPRNYQMNGQNAAGNTAF